jgi:hypothetical protein
MRPSDINNRFTYHAATTREKQLRHATVRSLLGDVARELNDLLPEGREKSLCVTHLEEAMFWANAALARPSLDGEFKDAARS